MLHRALYETRADPPIIKNVVDFEDTIKKAQGTQEAISLLTRNVVVRLGGKGLVAFARRLLRGTDGDTESRALASDIAVALETFPQATASFLYMGLLAETYLDSANRLMVTPNGAVAQRPSALLERPLAAAPLAQLRKKSDVAARRPITGTWHSRDG